MVSPAAAQVILGGDRSASPVLVVAGRNTLVTGAGQVGADPEAAPAGRGPGSSISSWRPALETSREPVTRTDRQVVAG
jgi:hypothetical protein